MARRRGPVRSLSFFANRSMEALIEKLESRVAPGGLVDCFGLTALAFDCNLVDPIDSQFTAQGNQLGTQLPGSFAQSFGREESTESNSARASQDNPPASPNGFQNLIAFEQVHASSQSSSASPNQNNNWIDFGHGRDQRSAGPDFLSLAILPGFDLDNSGFGTSGEAGSSADGVNRGARTGSMLPGIVPVSKLGSNWSSEGMTFSGRSSGPVTTNSFPMPAAESMNFPVFAGGESVQPGSDVSPLMRGRLPHERPAETAQSMFPYAIDTISTQMKPTTGVVRMPAEYDPMRGVVFSYTSFGSIVTDMVKELTEDPTKDDIAYVVVSSTSQQNSATNSFIAAGADMSKVQFFIQPSDSVWIRDYGPHFVTVDDSLAIVDSHYYESRPVDNFMPTRLGDMNFNIPTYDMGLYYSGGNFQPGPNNSGFTTSLVDLDNPASDGFTASSIAELYQKFQGIDTLHVMPKLPFSVDGTGHVDMWLYLVDEDTVILSEFKPGSNATAISITNNAVSYMENLGFEVFRPQAWNVGSTHYTYTNAFRVNDRIFVPVYGTALKPGGSSSYNDEDADAIAKWQAAAGPGVEIIPIQSFAIIPSAGAIHCIVMQVPRHTGATPAADVLSPTSGELLLKGSQHKIEWSAIDTNNVNPSEIRVYLSRDGGANYSLLTTTTDTGSYLWNVNGRSSSNAIIKVVAKSADGDEVEAFSSPFKIAAGTATKYDFSTGAGVDKFAYGSQTTSWSSINANPMPVTSQLSSANYAKLATSNATGGDTDANRYIAPTPGSTSETTHLFQFTLAEAARKIAQLDVLWEGYADACTQAELYVWDLIAQNWGDGAGLTGHNRYMDSWAGNWDGTLVGSIRSNLSRYVDDTGLVRFLVLGDRSGDESFHDYMSVTVKEKVVLDL